MFFEPIQPVRPEAAVAVEPPVDFGKGGWVEAVDASLRIAAVLREAGFSQDSQVARDRGLTDRERFNEFAGAALSLAEHLYDLSPGWVRKRFEGIHRGQYSGVVI